MVNRPLSPPRPYQLHAVAEAIRHLSEHLRTLLVMATGTGKTRTALMVCEALRKDGPILWLTNRRQLVKQTVKVIQRQTVLCVGVEMAEERADWARPIDIVVASQQSLASAKRRAALGMERFALIVIDEAHHATAKSWRAIVDDCPNAKVLGLTATPNREDGDGLGSIFASVAYTYGIEQAIADGYHKRIRLASVTVEGVDLSRVKRSKGDLADGDLGRVLVEKRNLEGVAVPTLREAGDRQTIMFTATVAHAHALAETMCGLRRGCARVIHGGTPDDERERILRDFERGKFQFLVNCQLLGEGVDLPFVSCVAMARPTLSVTYYLQCIGRGGRYDKDGPKEQRPDMLVLDYVPSVAGPHLVVDAVCALIGDGEEQDRTDGLIIGEPGGDRAAGVDIFELLTEARRLIAADRAANIPIDPKYTVVERVPFLSIEELRALPWATETNVEIGRRIGKSKERARAWRRRLGFAPRSRSEASRKGNAALTPEQRSEMVRKRSEAMRKAWVSRLATGRYSPRSPRRPMTTKNPAK